jgi:hypothetical protein
MTLILMILGYIVMTGITIGIIGTWNDELPIVLGLIWPISITVFVVFWIVAHIAFFVEDILSR